MGLDPEKILKTTPPELDLKGAFANIRRNGTPKRVFLFEHGMEDGIKERLCRRFEICRGLDRGVPEFPLARDIRLHQFLGQEFIRAFAGNIVWKGLPQSTTQVPPSEGPISSWRDLETYPWPHLKDVDFSNIEWFENNLPENMAMWSMTYLFQQVSNLLGFERFCLLLHEDIELVKAVTARVGQFFLDYAEHFCEFTRSGAINIGDDMGHKSGTFVSPRHIREIFMPWHKRIISAARSRGKLGFFHVCGYTDTIMDDLIDYVCIDAKHSTQDAVEPVQQTKKRWGKRIALLGGVDIDFITRAQPRQVETYTQSILETCVEGGGFALGLGNWVPDSAPLGNYISVLATARRFA